jgi:L-serine dehydratase
VSFDVIVDVMYQTGKDIHIDYRETSTGGLAKYYKKEIEKRELHSDEENK